MCALGSVTGSPFEFLRLAKRNLRQLRSSDDVNPLVPDRVGHSLCRSHISIKLLVRNVMPPADPGVIDDLALSPGHPLNDRARSLKRRPLAKRQVYDLGQIGIMQLSLEPSTAKLVPSALELLRFDEEIASLCLWPDHPRSCLLASTYLTAQIRLRPTQSS